MGRRCRRSLVLTNSQGQALGLEMETPQSQAEQRSEAVSRLKLLPVPGQVQEQVRNTDILISQDTLVSGMLSYNVQQRCAVWKREYVYVLVQQMIFEQVPQMKQIF